MIIKLILSNLELDLSNYEFTLIEENNWLKDNTISKFTYPIELQLSIEQDEALGNISEQNLSVYNTLLDGKFYVLGEEHDAVLEIESIIGRNVVAQIRYGLEEFPNFNKRLSELALEKFDLSESIYTHAETIIAQTWPAVNYNFPQVITDGLDTDTEQWASFEGIINKYVGSAFIENEFDAVNSEQLNKNILLPMPYLLYVLIAGFQDAGFNMVGEILQDTYYQKATLYALTEFYTNFNAVSEVHTLLTDEYSSIDDDFDNGSYFKAIVLPEPGRYKIAGNIIVRCDPPIPASTQANFVFNGSNMWQGICYAFALTYNEEFFSVDFNIDFTGTEGPLVFLSEQTYYSEVDGERIFDASIMDVTITQIAKYDVNGDLVSTLVEPTAIDLSKSVPNMSFGEYVSAVLKKRNYGYTIDGTTITIDKRKTKEIDTSEAVDLSNFEVATPERFFNRGKTFEFKTFQYDSEEYPQPKMFISNDGFLVNNYTKNDDTEEIIINLICLPLKIQGVLTAHDFLNDKSKLQLVLYSGLTSGVNLAEDPEGISLLNNYLDDYEVWFNFLLTSQRLNWVFNASYEQLSELKIRSVVYAYRQYHIINKLIRKSYLSHNKGILLEHEIETESLE